MRPRLVFFSQINFYQIEPYGSLLTIISLIKKKTYKVSNSGYKLSARSALAVQMRSCLKIINLIINVLDLESILNTSNKHRNLKCHRSHDKSISWFWPCMIAMEDARVLGRVHERWLNCFHNFLCIYFYLRIKSKTQRIPSRLPNYSSCKFPSGP